jgi:hypothetical protein
VTMTPVACSGLLTSLFILSVPAPMDASETMPTELYELTTETGMPHLEENLRCTTQREKVCLRQQALSAAFPILDHPALQGCTLQGETKQADAVSYTLVCAGGHGTTGEAIWHIGRHQFRGTLNIKLGGKNMTFYQRMTAIPLGDCPTARATP